MRKIKEFIQQNKMKLYFTFSTCLAVFSIGGVAFADNDWGVNIKTWLLNQASALALCAVVVILIPLIIKKMWAALIGTLIGAAVALFFINNPDSLIAIGASIKKIIFGS